MDPHGQISLARSHSEFEPYYHLSPTPPTRRSARLSISIPQRRVDPPPPTAPSPVPDTRPTYGQFPVNEPNSTRFAPANSDEPMPHQQDPERPPRPPNSWILYRSHMARERTDLEGRAQSEISAIISKAWRDAPADVKLHFEMLAEAKKVEHQARYPHYRFNPIKKSDKAKAAKKAKAANDAVKKVQAARGSRSVSPSSKRKVRNSKTRSPSPKNDPIPSLADQHFATYAPAPAPFFPINDDVPSPHLDDATSLPPSPSLLTHVNLPTASTSTPVVPPVPMVPAPLQNDTLHINSAPALGLFTHEPAPTTTSQWTPDDVTAWLQSVSPVTPAEGQVTAAEPATTERDHLHPPDGLAPSDLLSPIELEPFNQVNVPTLVHRQMHSLTHLQIEFIPFQIPQPQLTLGPGDQDLNSYLSMLSNIPDQSVFHLSYPQSTLTAEPPSSFQLEFGAIGDPSNPGDWAPTLGADPLSPPESTPHPEQQHSQDTQTLGVSDVVNFFNAFITDPHMDPNTADAHSPDETPTHRVSSSSTIIVKPEEDDDQGGLYQPPSGASAAEKLRSVGGCWGRRIPVPVDVEEEETVDSPAVEPQPWSVRAVS